MENGDGLQYPNPKHIAYNGLQEVGVGDKDEMLVFWWVSQWWVDRPTHLPFPAAQGDIKVSEIEMVHGFCRKVVYLQLAFPFLTLHSILLSYGVTPSLKFWALLSFLHQLISMLWSQLPPSPLTNTEPGFLHNVA